MRVAFDLRPKFVNAAEFAFISYSMQKTHPQNVAVEVAVKIENVRFDRRIFLVFKGRANTDIRDTSAPNAVNQICRRINSVFWKMEHKLMERVTKAP